MQKLLPLLVLLFVISPSFAAQRVEVFFNIPAGLEKYSGRQPVTFGVPFPEGVLPSTHGVRLVDAQRKVVPSQFEVTAHWKPDKKDVRWLLVDCFAYIKNGKAQRTFLEFGKDVRTAKSAPIPFTNGPAPGSARFSNGREWYFANDYNSIGDFVLRDGTSKEYSSTGENNPQWKLQIEKRGAVRTVVKMTGRYVADDGKSIAAFTTRVRLYKDCPFARVYHTLNWLTDDKTTIADLSLYLTNTNYGTTRIGLDAKRHISSGALLRQVNWDTVTGSAAGKKLDGWMQRSEKTNSFFVGLRWAWQQYPTGFATNGSTSIVKLIAPEKPVSLNATESAVPPVMQNVPSWNLRIFKGGLPMNDVAFNGPPALPHVSPRGISKTWEMLVWHGGHESPEVKNILTQHPVLAYADPRFATQAALPSPSSAYNPQKHPQVEAALQRAFGWYTRELPEEGDFGTWNYGDLQWNWHERGAPIYRYWMNAGKGWSILPWQLWLRSGDRRYWENGEANSRHVMDVDTCDVPGWERDPNDFKLRGGQYHYSALHWGYGPEVVTYYVDSEYLPYYYYMTGYERAKDAMLDHAEAVARFPYWDEYYAFFREDLKTRTSRHVYVMVKNLAVLYEATWDPRLKKALDQYLLLTLDAQLPSGSFPGVKTNHYLDEPLLIAARVYGWEKVGEAIKRWDGVLGDPLRPGKTGGVHGPMSLWTSVELYRRTKDKRYLDIAVKLMNAQASGVMDGDSIWSGMSYIPGHEAGPALRDWPVVMRALDELPTAQRPTGYMPIAGFHSRLPITAEAKKAGWGPRHMAFVLSESSAPLSFTISFSQQPQRYRVKVIAPDGQVLRDEERDYPYSLVSHETAIGQEKIEAGQKGVYVVELSAQSKIENFIAPVTIKSSTSKVVHFFPQGQRTVAAHGDAGQFWFAPLPGAEVSISFPLEQAFLGRTVALDPDGRQVGSAVVTGTREIKPPATPQAHFAFGLPMGKPCSFTAPVQPRGLYSFVVSIEDKWSRWCTIKGIRPFVSATREEWFDPTEYSGVKFEDWEKPAF